MAEQIYLTYCAERIETCFQVNIYDVFECLQRNERSRQPLSITADYIIRGASPEYIKSRIEVENLVQRLDESIRKGLRLLHYAVYQNEPEIVTMLLEMGANPNVMDEVGFTPIHICAEKGYSHLIDVLILYGTRIRFTELNADDEAYGNPPRATAADEPLRLAIRSCEHETVLLLLERGANPNAAYYLGQEINLVDSMDLRSLELLLLYGADPNNRDLSGLTPLMKACRNSEAVEAVHLLISYGADVNKTTIEDKKTSLHYAVITGNLEIVEILVFNGARVSFPLEKTRPPPLYYAVLRGNVEIVDFLLDSGADVNAVSSVVGSALHLALTETIPNQKDIVHTLLRRGANPNAVTLTDNRPAFKPPIGEYLQSCEHPKLEIIKMMLRYGARIVCQCQKSHNLGILKVIRRIHLGLYPDVMLLLITASESFDVSFIEESKQLSDDHKELLLEKAVQPFSLQHATRLELRKNLGWGPLFLNTVQNLPLPEHMKRYVLFEDDV